MGFEQASSRMAKLKLRVAGGKVPIVSCYAPHNGKAPEERQVFSNAFSRFINELTSNGPTLVFVDLSARLHRRFGNEGSLMGPHFFGNPLAARNPESKRSRRVETCTAHSIVIGDDLFLWSL